MTTPDARASAKEPTSSSPYHIPALDGLRAISILFVLLSHAGLGRWVPGGFGVTIFFFISGYLITTLLLREHQKNGRISLPKFFIRRALRLLPASLVFVVCGTAWMLWCGGALQWSEPFAALFYLANYYEIFFHFTPLPGTHLAPYNVLWSLAVEEHFYLLMAPAFAFVHVKHPRRFVQLVVLAILLPALIRTLYLLTASLPDVTYTFAATECRLDSIAYGVIVALGLQHSSIRTSLISMQAVILGTGLLLSSFLFRDAFFREGLRYSIQGLGLALVIPSLIFSQALVLPRRLLDRRSIVWLGQISYSLYLFHWIALLITESLWGSSPSTWSWHLTFWGLTFSLSALSYYAVEKSFLRLRHRFSA